MSNNLKEAGIGVIEIILLIGLISGTTLYILSRQGANKLYNSRSTIDLEIESTATILRQVLADPYNCSSSVEGITPGSIPDPPPGQPRVGFATGGDLTNGITTAERNPDFPYANNNPPIFTGKQPFLGIGEFKPGLWIDAIQLVNDEVNDFIRVRFKYEDKKAETTGVFKEINRDFILETKKDGSAVTECFLKISDEDLERACAKLGAGAVWTPDKKCELSNYFSRSRDLNNYYISPTGAYTSDLPTNLTVKSCDCASLDMCQAGDPTPCCNPSTCTGQTPPIIRDGLTRFGPRAYYNEYPAIKSIKNGKCVSESRCIPKPVGQSFKAEAL